MGIAFPREHRLAWEEVAQEVRTNFGGRTNAVKETKENEALPFFPLGCPRLLLKKLWVGRQPVLSLLLVLALWPGLADVFGSIVRVRPRLPAAGLRLPTAGLVVRLPAMPAAAPFLAFALSFLAVALVLGPSFLAGFSVAGSRLRASWRDCVSLMTMSTMSANFSLDLRPRAIFQEIVSGPVSVRTHAQRIASRQSKKAKVDFGCHAVLGAGGLR